MCIRDRHGLSMEDLKKYPHLTEFYNVLTTSVDKDGVEFVSTIEAKDFPFYGTQFHPEKNIYEWRTQFNINHEPLAIEYTQYMSNFFVLEARKNQQSFTELDEESYLIYNYDSVYVKRGYQKVFFFTNNDPKYHDKPIKRQIEDLPLSEKIMEAISF
eukprot:TRINITY_DN2951_c0_g1_i5.p1 TRINITY_DN2951_c0_g1~~TRINITY_DN2951_c0_g1_i5.p1  ORF type:complete len:157 (+),score=17.43 TRINITY_DN2951_c0_g1_i5:75-545(+)